MIKHLFFIALILASMQSYAEIGPGITVTADGKYKLKADGSNWSILFPVSNYKILQSKHRSNGKSRYFHLSNNEGINISFFIESTQNCTSSINCREYQINNPGPSMAASIDKRKYTINDFSVIYYMLEKADATLARKIPPLAGRTINQMNINAHYVNNGYWADLHISKMLSRPTDEATFKKFVSSIIISDE